MNNTINSVSEYLEFLCTLKQIRNMTHTVSSFTFFRGQANEKWKISPSLYRKGLFLSENTLLTEIRHICPNDIPENKFAALVKMQHYGMPTRLLDTTTNPLVALYFACEDTSQKDNNGAVFVFPNLAVSWSTNPVVELIMDFVFNYHPQHVCVDKMLCNTQRSYPNSAEPLILKDIESLLYYLTIPVFPVMPAKTNARIEAQDGAFFIFGMSLCNQEKILNSGTSETSYYSFDPVEIEDHQKLCQSVVKLIIPSSVKETILEQLDMLGINERKLFPDLSHQISYAVSTVIKNRFSVN